MVNFSEANRIIPILIIVIISAGLSYFERAELKIAFAIIYITVALFNPIFLYFTPLIFFDLLFYKIKWLCLAVLLPYIIFFNCLSLESNIVVISFIMFSLLLKHHKNRFTKLKKEHIGLQDNSKEMSMQLEIKNKKLQEHQDNEIKLARLNERNRIARDIHDNVGHILSSSILQIGALLILVKDGVVKKQLKNINEILVDAMNNIRNSVHDLHDESIELESEIKTILQNFTFCSAELNFDVQTNMEKNLKYCFISIVKEALSNIIKHSNATKVKISIIEHPALYQLIIHDNGKVFYTTSEDGIGLKNISDRINTFNGNLNINKTDGFRLFITVPKKTI